MLWCALHFPSSPGSPATKKTKKALSKIPSEILPGFRGLEPTHSNKKKCSSNGIISQRLEIKKCLSRHHDQGRDPDFRLPSQGLNETTAPLPCRITTPRHDATNHLQNPTIVTKRFGGVWNGCGGKTWAKVRHHNPTCISPPNPIPRKNGIYMFRTMKRLV